MLQVECARVCVLSVSLSLDSRGCVNPVGDTWQISEFFFFILFLFVVPKRLNRNDRSSIVVGE